MDGMRQGSGGSGKDHAVWSSAAACLEPVRPAIPAQPSGKTCTTDDIEHPDALAVRRPDRARPSFAVTPTLYFHADTSAAVALTVGVESVVAEPQRASADVQAAL